MVDLGSRVDEGSKILQDTKLVNFNEGAIQTQSKPCSSFRVQNAPGKVGRHQQPAQPPTECSNLHTVLPLMFAHTFDGCNELPYCLLSSVLNFVTSVNSRALKATQKEARGQLELLGAALCSQQRSYQGKL